MCYTCIVAPPPNAPGKQATTIVLKVLQLIISTVIEAIVVSLQTYGLHAKVEEVRIASDICTIYKDTGIEPSTTQTICCQKCFTLNSNLADTPQICTYRQSTRAHQCSEPLWTYWHTGRGRKRVPKPYYSTQDFHS